MKKDNVIDFKTAKERLERKKGIQHDQEYKEQGVIGCKKVAKCFVDDVKTFDIEALVVIRHDNELFIYDGISDAPSIVALTFRLWEEHEECINLVADRLNRRGQK